MYNRMKGECTLNNIPVGTYLLTASKEGYISQTVENVEVLEGQATVRNFELIEDEIVEPTGGEENMETHTEPIIVEDGSIITIYVPVHEPSKPIKIRKLNLETPLINKTVDLLPPEHTEENPLPPIHTKTTDMDGIATFENVLHGNYIIEIS